MRRVVRPRSVRGFVGASQVSQLREMPEGASEIETALVPVEKVTEVVDRLKSRETMDDKVSVAGREGCQVRAASRMHLLFLLLLRSKAAAPPPCIAPTCPRRGSSGLHAGGGGGSHVRLVSEGVGACFSWLDSTRCPLQLWGCFSLQIRHTRKEALEALLGECTRPTLKAESGARGRLDGGPCVSGSSSTVGKRHGCGLKAIAASVPVCVSMSLCVRSIRFSGWRRRSTNRSQDRGSISRRHASATSTLSSNSEKTGEEPDLGLERRARKNARRKAQRLWRSTATAAPGELVGAWTGRDAQAVLSSPIL